MKYKDIEHNAEILEYYEKGGEILEESGYTDHLTVHMKLVARKVAEVLQCFSVFDGYCPKQPVFLSRGCFFCCTVFANGEKTRDKMKKNTEHLPKTANYCSKPKKEGANDGSFEIPRKTHQKGEGYLSTAH
ncbi:MAG: hypothetical protein IKI88_00305 [Anaerotignum sp.]|nr:hypothetical protein [Anaerotignum sp.]